MSDPHDYKIRDGDKVTISFTGGGVDRLTGTVRYSPCATGDSWIIEEKGGHIYYVQQFSWMRKCKC